MMIKLSQWLNQEYYIASSEMLSVVPKTYVQITSFFEWDIPAEYTYLIIKLGNGYVLPIEGFVFFVREI